MTSSRPYLIRGLYQWINDNKQTAHVLVNVEVPGVKVPDGFSSDGQIVLNISPSAVRSLELKNDKISFEGRFGGTPHQIVVPVNACIGIYSRETGQGMVFELQQEGDDYTPPAPDHSTRPSGKPTLKVVK